MNDGDRELKKRVLAALRFDDRLDAANFDLSVTSKDGIVTLSGAVDQPWRKYRASWIASRVPGVQQVINRILVEPPSPRTDKEIAAELYSAFVHDPYLDERAIQVDVEHGIVRLRGQVPALVHKRLAGVLAWWCAGVRDVSNDLSVEHPEPDTNEELGEAIAAALEMDPLAVHVTADHHVTLTGAARSPEEREAAENDAWCVAGTRSVDNRLEVVPIGPVEAPARPGG
ncbi:MAG: hypothetical protein C4345_02470 [Chloroflexota bacterium]